MLYGFKRYFYLFIDTTRQIAETLYFPLSGVDALRGKDLRSVFCSILGLLCYDFASGVDLAAETFTGQGLLDELFPLAGKPN
jgi:hypothetical protein